MSEIFTYRKGVSPLLVSMPHSGEALGAFAAHMTEAAHHIADTDWHLPLLYDFLEELDATVIAATHSRYVIDLNRDPSGVSLYPGQNVTELCPTTAFDEQPLYRSGHEPDTAETKRRLQQYWWPYHQKLASEIERVRALHGYALLWDAHSIAREVPRFFEGTLPEFNLGTNGGASCGAGLGEHLAETMRRFPAYTAVLNGRFKGGYITRRYGKPETAVHAVQLELSQATYMQGGPAFMLDEARAQAVREPIRALLNEMLFWARAAHAGES